MGQREQAIADYSQAIDLGLRFTGAYSNRGECYHALQRYAEAVDDFTAAIHIDPTGQLYQARGEAYELLGNKAEGDAQRQLFEQAEADYDQAQRLWDTE